MESLGTLTITGGLNLVLGILVKAVFILLTLGALLVVRQTSLMNRVVSVPTGGWFKGVSLAFLVVCALFSLAVISLV